MLSQTKLLSAIAAVIVTEELVQAQTTRPRSPADLGYFATGRYRRQSAQNKINDLWTQCLAEISDAPAPENYGLDQLFREDMSVSFNRNDDEMPEGRLKYNHAQGVVGRIAWEDLGTHTYTGLYDGGSDLGLIRFSEGNFLLPETTGLTPTLAIKFPLDGMPSANILANTNFEPSSSFNFFANHFHTRIPFFSDPCARDSVQKKFAEHTGTPQSLGLSEFSRFGVDGVEITDFEFPFDLMFVPNPELANLWSDERPYDADGNEIFWWDQMKEIPEDTVILQVMARSHPDDPVRYPESTMEHIANIRLTSRLITSIFGDRRLFFSHEGMRDDFEAQPDWRNYVPRLNRNGPDSIWGDRPIAEYPSDPVEQKAWVRGQMAEYGCPFAWLFDNVVTPIFD